MGCVRKMNTNAKVSGGETGVQMVREEVVVRRRSGRDEHMLLHPSSL